jgi:hypothetical protein
VSSNKPKTTPKGDYAVGYARPRKQTNFSPVSLATSPAGRAADRPLTS